MAFLKNIRGLTRKKVKDAAYDKAKDAGKSFAHGFSQFSDRMDEVGNHMPEILKEPKEFDGMNIIEKTASVGWGAAQTASEAVFKVKPNPESLMGFDIKATGKGKAIIGSAIIGSSMLDAANYEMNSWNGVQAPRMEHAGAPDYRSEYMNPSYMSNAEADGSLVFAMYKNRMG